jgi:phosphate/sulfate permease
MPPETVQIGPLIISKVVLDVLAPLIGTLVGGFITYISTRTVENRKWEQQKRDKFQEQRREAIALALEWLDPIRSALSKATLITSSKLFNRRSDEDFRKSWPNLLATLSQMDPPARLQVMLPQNTYERGLHIIHGLDELRSFLLIDQPTNKEELQAKFEQCSHHLSVLQNTLRSLEKDLTDEYKRTFQ